MIITPKCLPYLQLGKQRASNPINCDAIAWVIPLAKQHFSMVKLTMFFCFLPHKADLEPCTISPCFFTMLSPRCITSPRDARRLWLCRTATAEDRSGQLHGVLATPGLRVFFLISTGLNILW